jgi:stage IV sporulation protein FB
MGHVFFFWLFNIDIESIEIHPFGGITKVNKRIHERIYKDFLIALGGIIFQLLGMFMVLILFRAGVVAFSTYELFITYNIRIILFNLIPIIPLDGSKLLLGILLKFISFKNSYYIMFVVSIMFMVLFVIYNYVNGLNDIVIVVFLVVKMFELVRNFKYLINSFYLERVLYDNYYNGILYDGCLENMRIDKYYYFKNNGSYLGEKKYLLDKRFKWYSLR